MKNKCEVIATFLLVFAFCLVATAQSFHKTYTNADDLFTQRILRLDDGGFLIGDSFLTNGEIFLTRFFKCGEVDWSFSYRIAGAFTEFKDFILTSEGNVVLFGSYFFDNSELIFLQKIDIKTGKQITFNTYDPVFQDHFTYSIDILDGEIMIYGLLLDFNIPRRGFVAKLGESLNVKWAHDFSPFEKEGHAILTADGIMCRSEYYHMKFDEDGALIWANELTTDDDDLLSIAGPYATEGGYLFEANIDDYNFFYKLDEDGDFLWSSDKFPSLGGRSALTTGAGTSFLVTHYFQDEGMTRLGMMDLDPDGAITNQRHLITGKSFVNGSIQHSLLDETLTIAGSPDPFANSASSYQEFIINIEFTENNACYPFQSFEDLAAQTEDLRFVDYSFEVMPLSLKMVPHRPITMSEYEIGLEDICSDILDPEVMDIEEDLICGEGILLSLPSEEYTWDDLRTSNDRTISEPGIYTGRTADCAVSAIVNFIVNSPDCDCKLYFPDAISPNEDGVNDTFEYFSSCDITTIDIAIFNRWGERVFRNQVVGQFWSPVNIDSGVYIVTVKYETRGVNGKVEEKSMVQSLTVLR